MPKAKKKAAKKAVKAKRGPAQNKKSRKTKASSDETEE